MYMTVYTGNRKPKVRRKSDNQTGLCFYLRSVSFIKEILSFAWTSRRDQSFKEKERNMPWPREESPRSMFFFFFFFSNNYKVDNRNPVSFDIFSLIASIEKFDRIIRKDSYKCWIVLMIFVVTLFYTLRLIVTLIARYDSLRFAEGISCVLTTYALKPWIYFW